MPDPKYTHYSWFSDRLKMMDGISLSFWKCKYEPALPKRWPRVSKEDKEAVDPYFLPQMVLEAKGWQSFCVASYSDHELMLISQWRDQHDGFLMPEWHDTDVIAITGQSPTRSFGVTVPPKLAEPFAAFLDGLRWNRPCFIVTKEKISKKILALLPENHLIVKGDCATAISMERNPKYQMLVDIL